MKGFQVWKITETKTQKIFAVTVLKKTMRVTTTKKSTKDIAHTKIRMEYSGESKASLHCGFNLCFSDWWRILLHPWVSQQRRIIYAVRKRRNIYGRHSLVSEIFVVAWIQVIIPIIKSKVLFPLWQPVNCSGASQSLRTQWGEAALGLGSY